MNPSEDDAKLQVIIDAVPSWIAYVDADRRYRRVNAAYRAAVGDVCGQPMREVLGADYELVRHHIDRVLEGAPVSFEVRTPDERRLHVHYEPDCSPDGAVLGFVSQIQDVTELFEAERRTNVQLSEAVARQSEADRRKDEFLAILGHELRNPLAPIITALDLMAMSSLHHFARERDVIRRQADHLTRLVDDLLDVSRLTRAKIQLRVEPVEVWSVISHAIEMVSPLLEKRRHQLAVDVPRDGLVIEGDAIRLSQILSNLLTNAAKYTEPGGRIAVRAARDGDAITIAVEDNGNGISRSLLPHVFDPFVQSDRTIDRAEGGLGLGLALVRSLTQLHGGTVTAHSEGPGAGSRFELRLPAPAATVTEVIEEITSPVPRPQPGAAGRVLVVDDNADAADMLADVLRGVGYEVVVAHDAPTALHLAARFCPAIALLDIGLPVMDGYELARHLRAVLVKPPRLIAVTGYGDDADVRRSRDAGFEVHLGKPVSFEQLVKILGDPRPAS